jgi:PKD repeat protein
MPGTYTVSLIATNADGSDSEIKSGYVTVSAPPNNAPILTAIGSKQGAEGKLVEFTLSAADIDNDYLAFSEPSGLPSGAVFYDNNNGTATFSWIPGYDQANDYSIVFIVTDGTDAASETVAIQIDNVNRAPTLAHIGSKVIHEQDNISFSVISTDPDAGDALSVSASNLPFGAIFTDKRDSAGIFVWIPGMNQAGTYSNLHFEVTDGEATDYEDMTITVLDGAADCTPGWQCLEWSACADSIQIRSCSDNESCGTDTGKPDEVRTCDSTAPEKVADLTIML